VRRLLLVLSLSGCGAPAERPPEVAVTSPRQPLPERLGVGRPATPEEIAAWDLDVDATGAALPPGRGTVAEGQALYAARCAACHGVQGEGGIGPQLVAANPKTGFAEDPKIPRTIGNWWPYATTIFDYLRRAMPQTQPGSLTSDETYALVAFLLHRNEVVPAEFVADADAVRGVTMPTQVKFVEDDRDGAKVVR
jgi:mono/diheme cytochrome c family protein